MSLRTNEGPKEHVAQQNLHERRKYFIPGSEEKDAGDTEQKGGLGYLKGKGRNKTWRWTSGGEINGFAVGGETHWVQRGIDKKNQ